MNQLISRLIAAANTRGLSPTNPVLLTTDGNGNRINIIVSHEEPIEVQAPLNLVWINPLDSTTMRRVSRESSQSFEHTWSTVTQETLFAPQIWDEPRPANQDFRELNANVGNPHNLVAHDIGAITFEGGQFTGAILPRIIDESESYDDNEAAPVSFIRKLLLPIQSSATSTFQQLNSIRNQLNSVRTRVTAVELRLDSVAGAQRYVYSQSHGEGELGAGERDWTIAHQLNAQFVEVSVFGEDGRTIIPDRVEQLDANTVKLVFAEITSGTAVVLKVM